MQKTIFITGASAGLGKAAAKLFQSNGWKVIATMRNPEKETELNLLDNVVILPLDVTKPTQITEIAAQVFSLGKVDVVLNNVGAGLIGPLEPVTKAQLTHQFETNLFGAIWITQAFTPYFREQHHGMFINITSMAGLVTFPFDSLYHTVKFALQGFSEAVSYELSRFGITVKTVAPGYIRTDFGSNMAITSSAPYQELMNRFLTQMTSMMDPKTSGSTAEQVAELVYEAVTDGKDQLLYVAGNDANDLYQRRLQIGSEAARQEMEVLFLGNR